ncbi:RNA polymerase sigma factor [Christiangramia forsetii]|uniref:RNA polymerase sigma factor n=2 Tax=Christiangramia forsetii TaxID=411153 RepID=A0LYR6_CHRFK|nr:RNA polymerase sigma factor [Christiangramia forsetii]GGG33556.1 RNA polymerase sigma factor [Christiangramia forsetii]CAL65511.1 RNA polymerase ECF-type sigma factor [Christiangramia forsetii KT0803]
MIKNTDQYLIEKVLNGDTNAFGELVDRYQNFVFTIAIRILKVTEEAEEVAQDSFIKAYDSLSSFRGDSKFSTWLYRIVYHKSLDRIKMNKRHRTYEINEEVTEDTLNHIENGLEFMLSAERTQIIKNCISQLPETEAAIISLYYLEEQSVKEIVKVTDLTEDNIKIKLYRSRKKLFSLLEGYIKPEISNRNGKAI